MQRAAPEEAREEKTEENRGRKSGKEGRVFAKGAVAQVAPDSELTALKGGHGGPLFDVSLRREDSGRGGGGDRAPDLGKVVARAASFVFGGGTVPTASLSTQDSILFQAKGGGAAPPMGAAGLLLRPVPAEM